MYLIFTFLISAIVNVATGFYLPSQNFAYASAAIDSAPFHRYMLSGEIRNGQHVVEDTLGQYTYGYATTNGMVKNEMRNVSLVDVSGGYAYVTPEGQKVSITYTTNKDGSKPIKGSISKPVASTSEATQIHLQSKVLAEDFLEELKHVLPYTYLHNLPAYYVPGSVLIFQSLDTGKAIVT